MLILCFCIMDIYYLSLERGFRKIQESFILKIHQQTVEITDLFIFKIENNGRRWKIL